jgi:hypothetical protein
MAARANGIDPLARARVLRLASRAALALWLLSWVAFGIVLSVSGSPDLVSAIAVVICLLFAISFLFESSARRIESRELAELLARSDLSAARSRGVPRVR